MENVVFVATKLNDYVKWLDFTGAQFTNTFFTCLIASLVLHPSLFFMLIGFFAKIYQHFTMITKEEQSQSEEDDLKDSYSDHIITVELIIFVEKIAGDI